MNKVFNINLGGYPFTIDADAYDHLSTYLKTIHNHFRQSEGYEEITSDIESRLAELFRDSLGSRAIVTLRDVEDAIAVMGTPEDFGAEPLEDVEEEEAAGNERTTTADEKTESRYRTGKRLFRNPEDETIGGVCSGIAAYFGIQDPLWVRLAFILATISGGFGIPLYLILWAILPKAETASDRLAMRGEPINVSNIGKIIEEEMENFSQKMSGLGDSLSFDEEGNPTKKKRTTENGQLRSVLHQFISALGKVIRTIFELIANIWKPILFMVMVILLIIFAAGWIGAIIGLFFAMPFMDYLYPEAPVIPVMGLIAAMIAVGIPLLMTAFGIGKRLFTFRLSNYVQAGFWGIWVVSLVVMGISISKTAQQFQAGEEIAIGTFADFPESDTLVLALARPINYDNFRFFNHELDLSSAQLESRQVELTILHTDDPGIYLEQTHSARGYDGDEAAGLASRLDYRHYVEGNTLYLDPIFEIPEGSKWRAQTVQLTLYIPEGKILVFSDQSVHNLLERVDFDHGQERPWRMSSCDYWVMGSDGLYCPDYVESLSESTNWDGTDYDRIHLEGPFQVKINRGDAYSLTVSGREDDLALAEIRQLEDLVDITANADETEGMLTVTITMPSLEHLDAERIESLEVFGFEEGDVELWLTEIGEARFFGNVNSLKLRQTGYSELELRGKARDLDALIEDRSLLEAAGFQVANVTLVQRDAARAELWVTDRLKTDMENAERVEIRKGNPERVQEE